MSGLGTRGLYKQAKSQRKTIWWKSSQVSQGDNNQMQFSKLVALKQRGVLAQYQLGDVEDN